MCTGYMLSARISVLVHLSLHLQLSLLRLVDVRVNVESGCVLPLLLNNVLLCFDLDLLVGDLVLEHLDRGEQLGEYLGLDPLILTPLGRHVFVITCTGV